MVQKQEIFRQEYTERKLSRERIKKIILYELHFLFSQHRVRVKLKGNYTITQKVLWFAFYCTSVKATGEQFDRQRLMYFFGHVTFMTNTL